MLVPTSTRIRCGVCRKPAPVMGMLRPARDEESGTVIEGRWWFSQGGQFFSREADDEKVRTRRFVYNDRGAPRSVDLHCRRCGRRPRRKLSTLSRLVNAGGLPPEADGFRTLYVSD